MPAGSQADLLRLGWSMLGKPYVKGTSNWTTADCSGLLRLLYDAVGVKFATGDGKLPHRAGMQMNYGTVVNDITQAQVGDAVFFGGGWNPYPPNGVGHVGIYIGNGMILEAANSKTGIVVRAIGSRQVLGIRSYTQGAGVVTGLHYDPSVPIPAPEQYPDVQIPSGTGSASAIATVLAEHAAGLAPTPVPEERIRPGSPDPGALAGPGGTVAMSGFAGRAEEERKRKDRLAAQLSLVGARQALTPIGTNVPVPGQGEQGVEPVMPAASTPRPRPVATRQPAGEAMAV